ncbi:hypothetical protein [Streptomyces sp. YIM 98790]|uniref:hypothetical protein n=1 Tax=Streptomyces sp. YIM 98790 TaxID=2689077 RepID=UPI001408895F|nr:hypothetical protein [Streptomyces sp. YIM 98790]
MTAGDRPEPRRRTRTALTAMVLATVALLVPGQANAATTSTSPATAAPGLPAQPAAPGGEADAAAAAGPPADAPVAEAELASGARLKVRAPEDEGAAPVFQITPGQAGAGPGGTGEGGAGEGGAGEPAQGPYAFTAEDGTLTVQPLGGSEALPATEIEIPEESGDTGSGMSTMGGAAELAAFRTAAPEGTYPVKLVLDTDESFAYKSMVVWNRQTWTTHWVRDGGTFTDHGWVNLPPGSYLGVTMFDTLDRAAAYLLVQPFTVTDSRRTIVFDAGKARDTRISVDAAHDRRADMAVSLAVPRGGITGFVGVGNAKVHVTPFTATGTELHVREVRVQKGTTPVTHSPYRYDLFHSFVRTVPSSPVVSVRTADLATSVSTFRSQGNTGQSYLFSAAVHGPWMTGTVVSPVRLPARVTEYQTPGVSFSRVLMYGDGQLLDLADRTLPAGTSPGETIGIAPFAPRHTDRLQSRRYGDTVTVYEPVPFTDATGRDGHGGSATWSYRLTADGTTIGEGSGLGLYDSAAHAVPSPASDMALDHTVTRRSPQARLSTTVRREWTYRGSTTGALPLLDVDFWVSGLNSRNTSAGSPVRISANARSRSDHAQETLTGLEFSTDDGATWRPLEVPGTGKKATVELAVPADAAFVSLRATAEDDNGGTVRHTVVRAFAGPAGHRGGTVGDISVSGFSLNDGSPLVVGTRQYQYVNGEVTVTVPDGLGGAEVMLYRGSYDAPDAELPSSNVVCEAAGSSGTYSCGVLFAVSGHFSLGDNGLAGPWKAAVMAWSRDGSHYTELPQAGTTSVRRHTTVDLRTWPRYVAEGEPMIIAGQLDRADWAAGTYRPLGGQWVALEHRAPGSSTWIKIKGVKSAADGDVRTTVPAANGYYRWRYKGGIYTAGTVFTERVFAY